MISASAKLQRQKMRIRMFEKKIIIKMYKRNAKIEKKNDLKNWRINYLKIWSEKIIKNQKGLKFFFYTRMSKFKFRICRCGIFVVRYFTKGRIRHVVSDFAWGGQMPSPSKIKFLNVFLNAWTRAEHSPPPPLLDMFSQFWMVLLICLTIFWQILIFNCKRKNLWWNTY